MMKCNSENIVITKIHIEYEGVYAHVRSIMTEQKMTVLTPSNRDASLELFSFRSFLLTMNVVEHIR